MNGKSAILCAVATLVVAIPAATQTRPRPPQSVFGVYGEAAAGHNSVRVTKKPRGRIGVAVNLYYAQGHTCRLNKDGVWREDHVAVEAEGLDPGLPCRLNAYFDKGHIVLKDEGLRCAPVYCGTRGKLDQVSLPKAVAAHK